MCVIECIGSLDGNSFLIPFCLFVCVSVCLSVSIVGRTRLFFGGGGVRCLNSCILFFLSLSVSLSDIGRRILDNFFYYFLNVFGGGRRMKQHHE